MSSKQVQPTCGHRPPSLNVSCKLPQAHTGVHRHEDDDCVVEWESHLSRADRLQDELRFALTQLTYREDARDNERIEELQKREGIW